MIAPARLIVLALLLILPLFPPEARGEALAGCALLIGLMALASWRLRPEQGPGQLLLVLAATLALPASWAALAPAAAVEPLTLVVLAAAAGIAAFGLRADAALGARAAVVTALAGSGVAGHGLYQKLRGLAAIAERVRESPWLPDQQALLVRLEAGRAFAGFATPAALGGYLSISLPVTVALALAARGGRRALWSVAALVQLGGFVAAASATAGAALLAALLLAATVWSRSRRVLAAAVAAIVLLLVVVALSRGDRLLRPSEADSPWRLRAGNVRSAWTMASDHPWIGVGPGGFGEVYPAYRRSGDNETRHAHNLPLELSAELGWGCGALVTIFFFYLFLRPLWLERHARSPWRQGVAVGLAAFALQNLADFTGHMPSLLWTAALLAGLVGPWPERNRARVAPALAGASLAAVLIAGGLAVGAGLSWNARHQSRRAAFEGHGEQALALAERASRLAPWEIEAGLLLARLSVDAAEVDAAMADAASRRVERAVQLSPVRASARGLRAGWRMRTGDAPGALADLSEAARLYPMDAEYADARDRLRERLDRGAAPWFGDR